MKAHKFAIWRSGCDASRSAPRNLDPAGLPEHFPKPSEHLGRSRGSDFGAQPAPARAVFLPPAAADGRIKEPVYNEEIAISRDEARRLRKSRNVRVAASTRKLPRAESPRGRGPHRMS